MFKFANYKLNSRHQRIPMGKWRAQNYFSSVELSSVFFMVIERKVNGLRLLERG
jgi:hypothetical protein